MSQKPRSADLHPGPGFQICLDFDRLDWELTQRFLEFETPDISDMLNRLYAVDAAIHCLTPGHARLCGPACTVRVFAGDNLMVHKVLDVAQPGDVVVVDARGSQSSGGNAVLGDIICTKAKHRGIQGFIIDGLIRDLPGIQEIGIPVFARGTTSIGPLHRGPGEINFPVACGGTVINAGDVVVADAAGIVAVPRGIATTLLDRLESRRATAVAYLAAVQRGEFSNEWVDRLLDQQNCVVYERGDQSNGDQADADQVSVAGPQPAVLANR